MLVIVIDEVSKACLWSDRRATCSTPTEKEDWQVGLSITCTCTSDFGTAVGAVLFEPLRSEHSHDNESPTTAEPTATRLVLSGRAPTTSTPTLTRQ